MEVSRISQFADLVRGAERIAVLSGAGISTASGIPDFRSPTGFYSNPDNANVFDIEAFVVRPEGFYEFARRFYPLVRDAEPNAAHRALAAWEGMGKDVRISTQNIDDLHERAGSTHVYYVHGNVTTSTCQECHTTYPSNSFAGAMLEGQLPLCTCGGVLKPDITFFGEPLPEEAWRQSEAAISGADLVLVVGTSLVVYPAASLPQFRRPDARLAIINRDPTDLDRMADLVMHDDISEVFRGVDRVLKGS